MAKETEVVRVSGEIVEIGERFTHGTNTVASYVSIKEKDGIITKISSLYTQTEASPLIFVGNKLAIYVIKSVVEGSLELGRVNYLLAAETSRGVYEAALPHAALKAIRRIHIGSILVLLSPFIFMAGCTTMLPFESSFSSGPMFVLFSCWPFLLILPFIGRASARDGAIKAMQRQIRHPSFVSEWLDDEAAAANPTRVL